MNIFTKNRPGMPVVRPDDLVVLRIETINMEVVNVTEVVGRSQGIKPRLRKKDKSKQACLILHFPPQSFAEETFFEVKPPEFTSPENHPDPEDDRPSGDDLKTPVHARIANESRLVFTVPDNFDIEYSLKSVLKACKELPLKVSAAADGRKEVKEFFIALQKVILFFKPLFVLLQKLVQIFKPTITVPEEPAKYNVVPSGAVVNTLRIAAAGDSATLKMRAGLSGGYDIYIDPKLEYEVLKPSSRFDFLAQPAQPKLPDGTTTSIEMPWRLILSPHSGGRWRHAPIPVCSDKTKQTELWHTRLVTPDDEGNEIEPPYPDKKRTTRAIWALSGEGNEAAVGESGDSVLMQSSWPDTNKLPKHDIDRPFRTTLDNSDRFQIAHLSSNFSEKDYVPQPIDTNLMMLSAMGGWLDSRGGWETHGGFSLEEWVHRATMGRDHYVRVVYKGFLFPFGHRVSLVKVSERKFHNKLEGNPAYLRQRLFIVIREKERTFDDDEFLKASGNDACSFARKFPFSRVKILTEMTPDLDDPNEEHSKIKDHGQEMFWPHVGNDPFRFQCVATDLDGRRVLFDLPMIFVENTLAAPYEDGQPDYKGAVDYAEDAMKAFNGKLTYNTTYLNWQRVALAPSMKSGDTSVQVENMTFGGFVEKNNESLKKYSKELTRPIWVPQMEEIKARIGAIAHLSGAQGAHTLTFNKEYLKLGFNNVHTHPYNNGEVFVDIVEGSGPNLDFSSQGDKSGGFIQPNLKPAALSRLAGPVMSNVDDFIKGEMPPGAGFPTSNSTVPGLPMPLLFGCIPLGELIQGADITKNLECIPRFVSEAGSVVDSFFNDLDRLYGFISELPEQSASIAKGALDAFEETLTDLNGQANICPSVQKTAVANAVDATQRKIKEVKDALDNCDNWDNFVSLITSSSVPAVTNLQSSVDELKAVANGDNGVFLPAGLKQSILNTVQKLNVLLSQFAPLGELAEAGKDLLLALDAIVSLNPEQLAALLADSSRLEGLLGSIKDAMVLFRDKLGSAELLDGAPRSSILAALKAVNDIIGDVESLSNLVDMLTGDELTVRFDWNPEIRNWPRDGKPLFRANDKKGLLVAVEAKVKKSGKSSPQISVNCSLKHFDLVMLAPVASFLELNFEKIEFSVDSGAKMNVDVLLSDVKFVGVLSFVETLRDLIPLDGFSDPPYLDITSKGIDAGYSISLPAITCGILNIANVSLGAGFTVPFIGQPLSVRFNFCSRENPFLLTVYVFGGGGWFCVTVDPNGVQILEAGFEFGAAITVNFGVAWGEVHSMAGIYYRMENNEASLTGYFRMGGSLRVLGLITASVELYLALTYEFATGKCVGRASLSIGVKVLFFSKTVTISCERKFAGSNGDPTLRQMLGYRPELTLEEEIYEIENAGDVQYAWREYIEAYA